MSLRKGLKFSKTGQRLLPEDIMREYPRFQDVRLRWHTAFYDGAIEGMAVYRGVSYWFGHFQSWMHIEALKDECYANEDWPQEGVEGWKPPWNRRYVLYRITDQQLETETERQRLFE